MTRKMNIPNILTFVRICLIPLFVWQFFLQNTGAAAVILIASGVTDVLDGYIARTYNMVTKWGSVFDPIADKLTQLTAAFCIAVGGITEMWYVFGFMLVKEIVLVLGGIKLYKNNDTVVMAKWYGKIATFVFYCAVFLMIVTDGAIPEYVAVALAVVVIGFGLIALINYARMFFKIIKKPNMD